MSDEYTPKTDETRRAWSAYRLDHDRFDGEFSGRGAALDAEFDRWLAAHDREVVEAVVVRIAESVQNHWRNP